MTAPAFDRDRARRDALLAGAAFLGLALAWGFASTAFREADEVTHYAISRWLFRYPRRSSTSGAARSSRSSTRCPRSSGRRPRASSSILLGAVAAWSAARIFRQVGRRESRRSRSRARSACRTSSSQLYGILTELGFAAVLGAGFVSTATGSRAPPPSSGRSSRSRVPKASSSRRSSRVALLALARRAPLARRFRLGRFACAALLAAGTSPPGGSAAFRLPQRGLDDRGVAAELAGRERLRGRPPAALPRLPRRRRRPTPLFPFFVVGAIRFWRARLRLEIATIAFVVALHSVLRTFGLFGSAGYPRYLVTLAPLLGAISASGLEAPIEAWERLAAAGRGTAPRPGAARGGGRRGAPRRRRRDRRTRARSRATRTRR